MQDEAITQVWRTLVVIPFTTNLRLARLPTCVSVPGGIAGLREDSVAMCHQIRALDRGSIRDFVGTLPPNFMNDTEDALIRTLRL